MGSIYTRVIRTGLRDIRAYNILCNVEGQMSDGKWENTPGYEKYWKCSDVDFINGETVITIYDGCGSGFREMNAEKVRQFFARKIRAVVKDFVNYHDAEKDTPCEYLNYDYKNNCNDESVTVSECLAIADKLCKFKE